MPEIQSLDALEILDSRGRPTVQATCFLTDSTSASASVPSGASRGTAEALELRDEDPQRYRGLGCRKAVANISVELARALSNRSFSTQEELDRALLELDGTGNKSRLGANSLLAVSLAFARAAALHRKLPLFQHLAEEFGYTPSRLPRPIINLFSGGKHAGGQVCVQDVLVAPLSATTIDEALEMTWEIYQCAAEICLEKYGYRPLTADEGGLAPSFSDITNMLEDAVNAFRRAGLEEGKDAAIALDVAASHFYKGDFYHVGRDRLDSVGFVERLYGWLNDFPVIAVEDGLAEEDWEGWAHLYHRLGDRILVVGDDLLCTNPQRIKRAIEERVANALLLKVNQIGTLTEAAQAGKLAKEAGWSVVVSARSGETEDNWLADLATGWSGNLIKIGSITQSERLAKYNRLLAIEKETGWRLTNWPVPGGVNQVFEMGE